MVEEKISEAKSQPKADAPLEHSSGEGRMICHNCGQEIKPDEPKKKEDGTYVHQYEKGEGPRSEICEFC
ncbi:MAG: hypothetical protein WD940_01645 [Patescibacteria group bacterium]